MVSKGCTLVSDHWPTLTTKLSYIGVIIYELVVSWRCGLSMSPDKKEMWGQHQAGRRIMNFLFGLYETTFRVRHNHISGPKIIPPLSCRVLKEIRDLDSNNMKHKWWMANSHLHSWTLSDFEIWGVLWLEWMENKHELTKNVGTKSQFLLESVIWESYKPKKLISGYELQESRFGTSEFVPCCSWNERGFLWKCWNPNSIPINGCPSSTKEPKMKRNG